MKNMIDVEIKEGNIIILPQQVIEHLKIEEGESLRLLFTEKAIVMMKPEVFGEEILKKL